MNVPAELNEHRPRERALEPLDHVFDRDVADLVPAALRDGAVPRWRDAGRHLLV